MKLRLTIDPALEDWHDWFAWFPVRTDEGYLVWLEYVRRRFVHLCGSWDYMAKGVDHDV
jgi:hypothetical protein